MVHEEEHVSPVDLNAFMPAWGTRAACAQFSRRGAPWSWMYSEDLAESPDYTWPDHAVFAMKVCAGCPVRNECLEYAYEMEHQQSTLWWSGEPVESDRRFGVFGGLPGRMRERFAHSDDRIARSQEWFAALSRERNWTLVETEEERTA
jgi:hypothetical protein